MVYLVPDMFLKPGFMEGLGANCRTKQSTRNLVGSSSVSIADKLMYASLIAVAQAATPIRVLAVQVTGHHYPNMCFQNEG